MFTIPFVSRAYKKSKSDLREYINTYSYLLLRYLELEAHDRTTIDLPPIQHQLAAEILAVGKPTVLVLINGGAVAIDAEAAHAGPSRTSSRWDFVRSLTIISYQFSPVLSLYML